MSPLQAIPSDQNPALDLHFSDSQYGFELSSLSTHASVARVQIVYGDEPD